MNQFENLFNGILKLTDLNVFRWDDGGQPNEYLCVDKYSYLFLKNDGCYKLSVNDEMGKVLLDIVIKDTNNYSTNYSSDTTIVEPFENEVQDEATYSAADRLFRAIRKQIQDDDDKNLNDVLESIKEKIPEKI